MTKSYRKIQKSFNAGEVIFTENSLCDGMYIINSGMVSVYKTINKPTGQQEMELVRIGEKGMFGEMAVIDEQKRSASVKALETTEVTIITKEMFDDQLSVLPPWVVTMIKLLVNRIRMTNEKLRKTVDEQKAGVDTGGLLVVGDNKSAGTNISSHESFLNQNQIDETEQLLKDLNL